MFFTFRAAKLKAFGQNIVVSFKHDMRLGFFILLLTTTAVFGQSLESLNIQHWYDDTHEISFLLRPRVSNGQASVFYQLSANRLEFPTDAYTLEWQVREDFTDRSEDHALGKDSVLVQSQTVISGILTLPLGTTRWYLLAKVTNAATQQYFFYYTIIDPLWPVTSWRIGNGISTNSFESIGKPVRFAPSKNLTCFYYRDKFGAAQPPFAEVISPEPYLKTDSSFQFRDTFVPQTNGLYLIQEDTLSARGIAFLALDVNYPKYNKLAHLAGPLIYLTTHDEHEKLLAAKNEKPAFDRVILEITNEKERAKNLMRSYFQRVETANKLFTDYKEGWKTDRGMVYIIFGKPEEVTRTISSETWHYRSRKISFEFRKSGSVFCPENFKLVRDKKYMADWFSMVDLWRKGRL